MDIEKMEYETTKVAEILHGYVINGMFVSALALKIIFDNQLFRQLGCKTQKEYVEKYLPFDRTVAYKYIKVADVFVECLKIDLNKSATFGKYLSSGRIEDVAPVQHLEGDILSQVWGLGVKKLYLIASKMPIDSVKTLADKGAISFGDGAGLFFVDNLKSMSYDMLVTLVNGSQNGTVIISSEDKEASRAEIDLDKESKAILTQARFFRVKVSQLCQYANPSVAAGMGLNIPPEFTAKAGQLIDLTNRLLLIEEQLETLLGVQ
jgi:hypothetical protein